MICEKGGRFSVNLVGADASVRPHERPQTSSVNGCRGDPMWSPAAGHTGPALQRYRKVLGHVVGADASVRPHERPQTPSDNGCRGDPMWLPAAGHTDPALQRYRKVFGHVVGADASVRPHERPQTPSVNGCRGDPMWSPAAGHTGPALQRYRKVLGKSCRGGRLCPPAHHVISVPFDRDMHCVTWPVHFSRIPTPRRSCNVQYH